jgi:hypothetical protein
MQTQGKLQATEVECLLCDVKIVECECKNLISLDDHGCIGLGNTIPCLCKIDVFVFLYFINNLEQLVNRE